MPIVNVKPHKLRVVSMSVYFALYLSLESVMNAAQWRCKSAFAYYRLKRSLPITRMSVLLAR